MSEALFSVKKGVAWIRLNRPEAFNALNFALVEQLNDAIASCFSPEIRAVVITGTGKSFCAGGDLKSMYEAGHEKMPVMLGRLVHEFHRLILDIRLLRKPVIAAINGSLGGGGFSLALACDLRFAAEGVRFKQAYTSTGLSPDGGFTAFLPAIIGLSKASEMLFLDPVLNVEQAKDLGIVNDIFSQEELLAKVAGMAEKLAAGPTSSYATAKELLNESLLPRLAKQLEKERQGMIASAATSDAYKGIEAFIEKRRPEFTGK